MSDNCRELLRDALVLVAALALGLMTAWAVIRLQQPKLPGGRVEPALHSQP